MCKIARFMKSVTNTTNTTHTLTFLKSNYKYKRRVYTSMTHTHAKARVRHTQRRAAVAAAEAEDRCANAKNTLNNAINQIINTKRITCEIKLIFKLFILFVGQLLTHTPCHTRDGRRASDSVALTQNRQVVGGGGDGGGGGGEGFDDTSHQRRNYDKVSTGRCQIAQRLHQWTQSQMRQHDSQTRLAPPQQQQQCLYARNLACNQSSRRCIDSNWQDLSPVVARLSAKATTTTTTATTATTATMRQRWHTSSGSARNGRINVLSTLAAILFMALAFNATPLVDAGACWRSSQSNGKCSEIYLRNSTKAECCRYPELFYTDRDVTDVEFFFTTTVGDGMTCSPCALSCKSMQCGWNKKCVKRKGRPKCVCAPECGAAKRHKQRGQPKIYRGHEPHSEQLRMNRHIIAGALGTGGGGKEAVEGDSASAFFNEGKSPRDIRSLSSEITNVNLGVEHQMQMQMQMQNQNQNQRKLIIMQSQSQQKPQLSRRVEKPGRLLITANVEHDTEKPEKPVKPVQQRIQIISNVRMNSRKQHNHFNRDNFDDEFNDEDGDDENNEDDEDNDEDAAAADDEADAHNEDNDDDVDDLGDWLDDVVVGAEESTGNHRRSSDDSTRTPLESRRSFNLPSRHKANKNSNHNKKRRQHENEMELGKRQQENSNNNNFAIIKRFQLAAAAAAAAQPSTSASNARRLENTPNHEEVLLPAGDTLNVNSANNNNNNNNNYNGNKGKGKHNIDGGRQQRERHHHQQRKRKHQKQQQQQQQQQQQPQQNGHQHNHRAHKKHKKLKDHNANNNDNNVRTRTSSSATSSSGAQHNDNIATTTTTTATQTPIISTTTTMEWQTTAATTPVNSMSPSDDRRLLNHGSHIAKSSPSSPVRKQKTGASSEAFFGAGAGAGADAVGVGVGVVDGGVAADVGKSSLNSDDSTLLDGIYEHFSVYGFPNRQFEVAVENFHGPHPVCGTDGRTYNTECQLKKRACRTNNPTLAVAYRGHCRTSCNGVKCLNGQTCVEDQYTIPHCIACKIDCPDDDAAAIAALPIDPTRAVCGVDGKTYRSVCDINRMICKSGRSVAVAYPGPCRDDRPTCSEINCGRKHSCLVDLLTLEPRCVSCSYKCARKRRPTSLRFEEGKICGVNNRTYNSWCELRRDSCNTGFLIDVKAPGECQ